jgi:putative SOS response-associated peptidase YedK
VCGRFSLTASQDDIEDKFKVSFNDLIYQPRINIAPNQGILTVLRNNEGNPTITLMYWGFIPSWVKDIKSTNKPINARVETIESKPYFRHAFKNNRCLIPATGFYEWEKTSKAKIPYEFFRPGHTLFAFAGLWNPWQDSEGNQINTCTIITTNANEKLKWIHDRMPVILKKNEWEPWLKGEINTFAPLPDKDLEFEKVSPLINNPRYEINSAKS